MTSARGKPSGIPTDVPVIIATIFPEDGTTGVHTHFRQLGRVLKPLGTHVRVVTPFSWARPLTYFAFAPRLLLQYINPPASVVWYRHWHEVFLYKALRRDLAKIGSCVVYAQGPLEARAALQARTGPHQRVVMAVHFRASQADEYAEPGREIKRDSGVFKAIRQAERETILQLDGIVYVAKWAQDALSGWLPEVESVPSIIVANFVDPLPAPADQEPLGDLVTTDVLTSARTTDFCWRFCQKPKKQGTRSP